MPGKTNDLKSLRGVGKKLAEQLAEQGINNISDLLMHLPFRYEDRTTLTPIGSLRPGLRVLVNGKIEYSGVVFGRRRSLVVVLNDDTGLLYLRFFHFRQQQQQAFKAGYLRCFGEVRAGYKGLEMVHPTTERITQVKLNQHEKGTLTPIYPSMSGFGQHRWLQLTGQSLDLLEKEQLALRENLPRAVRETFDLPPLRQALVSLHRPDATTDIAALLQRDHPAQRRFIIEELAAHQLAMRALQDSRSDLYSPVFSDESLWEVLQAQLPFALTAAQQRVIQEIHHDLNTSEPMLRLLQGDVGAGKTVVAAAAAALAIASGYQVAVMAPTELLAEQHLRTLSSWFLPLGIESVWLAGKVTGAKREKALTEIAAGAKLIIGTHALLQDAVVYSKLGLVIVDEQHRFGVGQRLALRDKGNQSDQRAHQLVMTATPIPRTLAMSLYAGLDVSIIDELPPGRQPVKTVVISAHRRDSVIERLSTACKAGRQAYWVCTLVEESEQIQAETTEQTLVLLQQQLPELSIAMVHGRLKSVEKERVMQRFREGIIDLLVATTVIEVGVDVPNASLMVIDNAERLGLSQLHQLRGRIGRGNEASSCVLLYQPPLGQIAKARLETLRNTNDGFLIAEKDLELRGAGEVLGTRQTGMQQMKIADLAVDADYLEEASALVEQLITDYPETGQRLIDQWIGDAAYYGEA